jgi:nucleotide-binding universal stress UspA family protein
MSSYGHSSATSAQSKETRALTRFLEVIMKHTLDFPSIMVATDLSDSSIPALRYARTFAQRYSARLTVMYSDPLIYPVDMVAYSPALYLTPTPEEQARLRAAVDEHASAALAGWPFEIEVTVGQPVPAILEAAKERQADLVVVGTHLRRGWRRALMGSVSDGVIHGAECPVLTVARADQASAIRTIVCPVNFTDTARQSLLIASDVADAFGARLLIVHVVEATDIANSADDERRLRGWIDPHIQDMTSFKQIGVRGGASERVLDCAEESRADLLVIGAQHKTFRDTTVIGTTSERLIRFAPCPVLVVPRAAAGWSSKQEKEELTCS